MTPRRYWRVGITALLACELIVPGAPPSMADQKTPKTPRPPQWVENRCIVKVKKGSLGRLPRYDAHACSGRWQGARWRARQEEEVVAVAQERLAQGGANESGPARDS